jgi:hypothetical protein
MNPSCATEEKKERIDKGQESMKEDEGRRLLTMRNIHCHPL